MQGLKWTSAPADGHQFPRLRLRVKNNLVQLSGGTQRLPITSPEVSILQACCWCQLPIDHLTIFHGNFPLPSISLVSGNLKEPFYPLLFTCSLSLQMAPEGLSS